MKKGFTLTELLAVIVVLSVLIIIIFPAYIKTSETIKNSNLDSIKSIVSKSMLDYGNKYYIDEIKQANNNCSGSSCCMCFSVDFIKTKNIFKASNGSLTNPMTNEDLEGYVKLTYNTNKLVLESSFETSISNCQSCRCASIIGNIEEIGACN